MISAHVSFFNFYAASSKFIEGISKCVNIISELGEEIPAHVTADIYANEVEQIQKSLRGKSRQELLSLPKMSDTKKLVSVINAEHFSTSIVQVLNPSLFLFL